MRLDYQAETDELGRVIADLVRFKRMSVPKALKQQGRLLAKRAIDFTPPKTRAQGRRRVQKDISRLFFGFRTERQRQDWEIFGEEAVRLFISKEGRIYGTERHLFRPDATLDEMARHHQSFRTKRGRVTRAGTFTRDIGRWKFVDRMVVPEKQLKAYIAEKQFMVGRGKGGWAWAYEELGGKAPKWISTWRRLGRLKDDTAKADPSLVMENRSEWASGGDQDRVIENAIRSRIRDVQASMQKAIEAAAQKATKQKGKR